MGGAGDRRGRIYRLGFLQEKVISGYVGHGCMGPVGTRQCSGQWRFASGLLYQFPGGMFVIFGNFNQLGGERIAAHVRCNAAAGSCSRKQIFRLGGDHGGVLITIKSGRHPFSATILATG